MPRVDFFSSSSFVTLERVCTTRKLSFCTGKQQKIAEAHAPHHNVHHHKHQDQSLYTRRVGFAMCFGALVLAGRGGVGGWGVKGPIEVR